MYDQLTTLKLTRLDLSDTAFEKFSNKSLEIIAGDKVFSARLVSKASMKKLETSLLSSFAEIGDVFEITINIREGGRVVYTVTKRVEFLQQAKAVLEVLFEGEGLVLEFNKERSIPATVSYAHLIDFESSVPKLTALANITEATTNYELFGEAQPGSAMLAMKVARITLIQINNRLKHGGGDELIFSFNLVSVGKATVTDGQFTSFKYKWPDNGEEEQHFCVKVYKENLHGEAAAGHDKIDTSYDRVAIVAHISATSPVINSKGEAGAIFNLNEPGFQRIQVGMQPVTGSDLNVIPLDLLFNIEVLDICIFPGATGKPILLNKTFGVLMGGTVMRKHDGGSTGQGKEEFFPDQPCPIDEPPLEFPCYAYMSGPGCICKCKTHDYLVLSNCEGYCENWEIDDNGEGIATIVGITGCMATVQSHKEGEFFIKCTYIFLAGGSIQLVRKVAAYELNHVLGGSTDSIIKATPLVQPHPFVKIEMPAETQNDQVLQKDVDFIIHERKLERDLRNLDPDEVAARHYEVELKVAGTIADFFKETKQCRWQVISQGGRLFEKAELVKHQEFEDASFETKMPGENDMNPRAILLNGIGKHEIKIVATNPIYREGTDWIIVNIDLDQALMDEIDTKNEELKGAMSSTLTQETLDRIEDIKEDIRRLYQRALSDPHITVQHNYQDNQFFALGPGDMSRTQVKMFEDDVPDQLDGTVETRADFQQIILKEEEPKVFLSTDPVKNFWAVPENYAGNEYLYPEDGNLRGEMGTSLTSKALCCECDIVIFGVHLDVPTCKKFKSKEPKQIRLTANGQPDQVDGTPGNYKFSVIAKPGPDALVTINPDTFTPASTAMMTVDTEGTYTVKVEYELGGRSSMLTYAVADTKVLFSRASELSWSVKRVGKYEDKIKDHLIQPYYQQRLIIDPVRAAEMLIEPTRESVSHGGVGTGTATSSTSTVAIIGSSAPAPPDPNLVIGQKFKGIFRIPRGIEFAPGIFARAYYKPCDPDLTADDYEDFPLALDPSTPNQAKARIEAKKDMHAIHLMNIGYKEVQRLKGSAVPISFEYQLQDEICPETEQSSAADPDFAPVTSVAIAESTERTSIFNEYGGEGPTLVNLILCHRDLGECRATNATKDISNTGIHNVVNGNLFIFIDFFSSDGKGENIQLEMSYNSLNAIFQDSLEFYRKLNGLTSDFIHAYWDHNFAGKGWRLNYDLQVRHYIKPNDVDGKDLIHYCEFLCPDGNRIQFKGTEVDKLGIGKYVTEHDTDAYLNSVSIGVGLMLEKKSDGYEITTIHSRKLKFDDEGDLEEILTPLIQNGLASPLKVNRSANQVEIEDSSGRKVKIDTIPKGNLSFSGTLKAETPHGMGIELVVTQSIINKVDYGGGRQVWELVYHQDFGQGDTCSIIKNLKDPNGHETEFDYYKDAEFSGVPKEVAENFWGRLGKAAKGIADRRTFTWFYENVGREDQKVIFKNPRDIDFVITYDVVRQALKEMQYARKRRDPETKILKDTPAYDPVAQSTANLELRPLQKYTYFEKTKHPLEIRNMFDEATTHEYVAVGNSRTHQLKKRTKPDNTFVTLEYDSATNFPEKITTPSKDLTAAGVYQLKYNTNFDINEKVWPDNPGLVDRNGNPYSGGLSEKWDYDPATGRLETYTNIMGTVWTFKYGEEGRDPQNLGLYTSKRTLLQGNSFEHVWEFGYDLIGQVTTQLEPQFGETQVAEFYPFGQRKRIQFQSIPTFEGTTEGFFFQYAYDDMFNKTLEAMPGAAHAYGYNEHGELRHHTDPLATTFETIFERDGSVKEAQNAQGNKTRFYLDELGRTIKKIFVSPDVPGETKPSEPFAILIEWDDTNKQSISRRLKANASGEPTADVVVENIDIFAGGQVIEQRTKLGSGGKERKVIFEYDNWGHVSATKWYGQATHKKTFNVIRDSWGQIVREEQKDETSAAARISEYVYRPDSNVVVHKQGNGSNVVQYRHDELGRTVEVLDNNGTTLQKLIITDFAGSNSHASMELQAIDPSTPDGTNLISASVTEYNRRGQPIKKTDSLGNVSEKKYDAQGRLRQEVDGIGNITHYSYDAADRVTKVEREITKIGNVSLHGLDKNDPGTLLRVRKLVKEITYAFNDELASVKKENGKTIFYEYDLHGRLKRVKSDNKVEQTIVYDALDRIKERTLPGNIKHTFNYLDLEGKVEATFDNDTSVLRLEYHNDWHGMLEKYVVNRFVTSKGFFAGELPQKLGIKYKYNGLGDIVEKIYISGDAEDETARISYGLHECGVIKNQITKIKSGTGELSFNQEFNYDENLRISEAKQVTNSSSRSGEKKFVFVYNNTGLLKRMSIPLYDQSSGSYVENFNVLTYTHDNRGRLTSIADGRAPYNGHIDIHYNYPQRAYIAGTLRKDDFQKRDLAGTNSMKGLTYVRNFQRYGRLETYTFFQDYMYDGEGNPHSWVSHIDYKVPGFISGNPGQEAWRTFEEDGVNYYNYKRYVKKDNLDRVYHFNYRTQTALNVYGAISDIIGERNARNSFDSFFGPASQTSQAGTKSNFRELKSFNGESKLPVGSWLIYEDPGNTASRATPHNQDVQKEFYHDAGGRLVTHVQQLIPRSPRNTFTLSGELGERSLVNESHHLYGPDGEEIFRFSVEKEDLSTAEKKLFIRSGDTLIAEIDLRQNTYLYHETVPGIGVRLSSMCGSITDKSATGEFYYNWDPNGSVLLVKDKGGEILCDFGIPSPDGELAQFGYGNDAVSEISQALNGTNISKENLYYKIAGGLDYLMGQSATYQNRNDNVMAMLGEASVVNVSFNNYAFNIGSFAFRQRQFTLPQQILQGVIDAVRGIGDALTSGYASKLRTYSYNYNSDFHAVQNIYAYGGGMVVGMAVSVYFGAVASTARLAQGSWAMRAAWLLTVSNDILGFADAVNNIRSGKATAFDLLGLASPISVFQSMRTGFARSSDVVNHIHLARNAAKLPTVEVRHIGNSTNEIQLVVNRTPGMAADLRGQDVINIMNDWVMCISANPGRKMQVSEALEGASVINVSREAEEFLESIGIKVRRTQLRNAGEADALMRKLYTYFHGKEPNTQVGHVLDLRINRGQTRLEIQTIEGIIESMTHGLYKKGDKDNFVAKMLSTIFEKQHAGTNMAVGGGPTKSIAGMIENGIIPENAKIVGVVLGAGWKS